MFLFEFVVKCLSNWLIKKFGASYLGIREKRVVGGGSLIYFTVGMMLAEVFCLLLAYSKIQLLMLTLEYMNLSENCSSFILFEEFSCASFVYGDRNTKQLEVLGCCNLL